MELMIIYDLQCTREHTFEGWFKSREEFDLEKKAGRLSCPVCGVTEVNALPSGGHVAVKGSSRGAAAPPNFAKALARYLEENFDNVGPGFADEALKMHFDEVEYRNIRGTVTDEEEQELQEEGVEYFKVPVRKLSS
ncbi:MAG: DUF1178 family protein [bacterium]|nr:DUF1178 family protein [bacterium]